MGFSNTWVAVKGVPKQTLLDRLGMDDTEFPVDPESEQMSVGRNSRGWILLCSNDWELGERAAELSQGGEAVACWIEDHVMTSGARGFSDGQEDWSVWYEEQRLDIGGDPPDALTKVHAKAKKAQQKHGASADPLRTDYIYEIPVDLAAAACGFRLDRLPQPKFTALKYKPRPRSEGKSIYPDEAKGFLGSVKLAIKRRLDWW